MNKQMTNQFFIKAVAYVRYSSDNQRAESIEAQLRGIEKFAKQKRILIIKVYSDEAKSATTDKRPNFQQMIEDSKSGQFSMVIVHKLDRFSRSRETSSQYKAILKSNGVKLISVLENLDDTPESIILESMLEGMAEYYSANLAREVMKGMTQTALQCKHTGGTPPLGYDVTSDKTYIINEEEAQAVKLIFEMYLASNSYTEIINRLNSLGFKTKVGNSFSKNGLNTILSNEKYSGVYIFNKDAAKKQQKFITTSEMIRVEDGIPAIITKEQFARAKEMMGRRKLAPASKKAKTQYLLSGIIKCGECGYSMQGNKRIAGDRSQYISYRCGCRVSKDACSNSEIKRETLEEFVLTELEKRLFTEEAISKIVKDINSRLKAKSTNHEQELQVLEKKVQQIEKELQNIVDAIMKGLVSSTLSEKLTQLESTKNNLLIEITKLKTASEEGTGKAVTKEQVRKMTKEFKQLILEKEFSQCSPFIRDFVKQVTVFKDHVEVEFSMVFLLSKSSIVYQDTVTIERKRMYDIYN